MKASDYMVEGATAFFLAFAAIVYFLLPSTDTTVAPATSAYSSSSSVSVQPNISNTDKAIILNMAAAMGRRDVQTTCNYASVYEGPDKRAIKNQFADICAKIGITVTVY